MQIQFSEAEIQRMIENGISAAVKEQLTSSYGHGNKLRVAVEAAIAKQESVVADGITRAVRIACASPEFDRAVQVALTSEIQNRFRGAFDGVIKAAAKRSASDIIVQQTIAEAVKRGASSC